MSDPADKFRDKKRRRNKSPKTASAGAEEKDTTVYPLLDTMARYAAEARVTMGKGHAALVAQLYPAIRGTFKNKLVYLGKRPRITPVWESPLPYGVPEPRGPVYEFRTTLVQRELRTPSGTVSGIRTLYHGMGIADLSLLLIDGLFKPSPWGLLGPGIYLGEKDKAVQYCKSAHWVVPGSRGINGALVECECMLGKFEHDRKLPADTYVGLAGVTPTWNGTLRRDEYCVQSPYQVRIVRVFIYTSKACEYYVEGA